MAFCFPQKSKDKKMLLHRKTPSDETYRNINSKLLIFPPKLFKQRTGWSDKYSY